MWLIVGLSLCFSTAAAEAIPVELQKTGSAWQLLRDGKPYLIRGAGGSSSLERLAAAGANSIRTWGADDIDDLLDQAHELGLTVTVGIWLGHERHGFDYDDAEQVQQQFLRARDTVLRYKDHPALLIWGIGNEMEGYEEGDDPAIWQAVNNIAAMVKELDPNHPTMTVTAEIGGARIAQVHERCSAIDIHGINSYGGAPSLLERYRAGGGTKPYVLTEFGPPGSWEVATTEWGAPHEPTSTEKAFHYKNNYRKAVTEATGVALGAYAFTWGFKMEATATWFGMFVDDGSRLGAIDAMTEIWSGSPPANRAPTISPLIINGPAQVKPGADIRASTSVTDPEGGQMISRWVLRAESHDYLTGGDFRPTLPDIEGAIVESNIDTARVRMPQEPGSYRLFFYAYDQDGNAATANAPLLVEGQVRTQFPVSVYDDSLAGMPWAPSGWMGTIGQLTLDGDYADNPRAGRASIKLRYTGRSGWVAVAWQNPPNNWGNEDGGYDLTGATALTLWARGEYGGEKIEIRVGLLGADAAYPDSVVKNVDGIMLSSDWQQYRIPLKGEELSSIATGFIIRISGRATPVTVYLDSIRYVR